MTSTLKPFALALCFALLAVPTLHSVADEANEIAHIEAEELKSPKPREAWATEVKSKYGLTDEQMKAMDTAGIQGPHLAFTAALAKQSNQPIDAIIQMRTTEKMGWGAIAKKLNVHPSIIGKSVSALRHEIKADAKAEKRAEKAEKKAAKKREHEERKKNREERREERREEKAQKKNAP